MIIDTLENLGRYAALSPATAAAVRFLAATDLSRLALGRNEVDGDRVYANVSESTPVGDGTVFEAHRKYTDVQVILSGKERFLAGPATEDAPYDEEKDISFPKAEPLADFTLGAGSFVLFPAGEPHSPGNAVEGGGCVRKVVVKVRAEE